MSTTMASSPTLLCILLIGIIICINDSGAFGAPPPQSIYYNGFKHTSLLLGGAASITQDGVLSLTNSGSHSSGHGFHHEPILMGDRRMSSFSVTFVFTVSPYFSGDGSDEMAFVISSTSDFNGTFPGVISWGQANNASFLAIVLGADLNKPVCISSNSVEYHYTYDVESAFLPNYEALMHSSGKPVQLWADYNGTSMELHVTLALVPMQQLISSSPLLSYTVSLSSLQLGGSLAEAYVGFSSSTGENTASRQVLGWSFSLGGLPVQPIDYSLLPFKRVENMKNLVKWLPAIVSTLTVLAGVIAVWLVLRCWRKKREARQEEGWEAELGPRRFSHNVLRKATNGFSSRQMLGQGGFGQVYGGVLAASGTLIAVKQISSNSKQGPAQFMAEVVILGRLRHRNLVRLIGYCRRKDELFLVYEYMPNGSLDRYLYGQAKQLIWSQRLHIIKGITSGLLYLHEDWEQVIVHRDVKASNVLLDGELNGRLGDFGLARLHDHGAGAHTTHVAGTRGYLAPELLRFGKATKATDVFAFGAFVLEVACGRRPMGLNARGEPLVLVDWVRQVWMSGCIVDTMDPRLEDYADDEAELVLKLGLLCSHPLPAARPSMRLVMQYLDGDLPLPEFSPDYFAITNEDQVLETSPSVATTITGLSGGR